VTASTADRYVCKGRSAEGPIAYIYPGTLPELLQAIEDTNVRSRFNPGAPFTLWAVKDGERSLIKTYVSGKEQA
jgi:hypothetical protein